MLWSAVRLELISHIEAEVREEEKNSGRRRTGILDLLLGVRSSALATEQPESTSRRLGISQSLPASEVIAVQPQNVREFFSGFLTFASR